VQLQIDPPYGKKATFPNPFSPFGRRGTEPDCSPSLAWESRMASFRQRKIKIERKKSK
jgi:hypothetical protein